ncbi:Superoxide dismutase OS=Lysinibacillus sphaericus OX=1421 GN=LS41612_20965 PE=3 SV=1 [Lysinibacillus sphaericus]
MSVLAEGVTLQKDAEHSLMDGEGTALVIHENEDDHMTDPTGESGGRIACGVIQS